MNPHPRSRWVLLAIILLLAGGTWLVYYDGGRMNGSPAESRPSTTVVSQAEETTTTELVGTSISTVGLPTECITGTVRNSQGHPVVGAAIAGIPCTDSAVLQQRMPTEFGRRAAGTKLAVSDEAGRFVLCAIAASVPHELTVTTTAEGGALRAPVLAGEDIEIRLGPVRSVIGTVKTAQGLAIAQAEVELTYIYGLRPFILRGASESDGSFGFRVPVTAPSAPFLVRLTVSAPGYLNEVRSLAIRNQSTPALLNVVLHPNQGNAVGWVTDQSTGRPIVRARIRCASRRFDMTVFTAMQSPRITELAWTDLNEVTTDTAGRFPIFPLGGADRNRMDRTDYLLIEADGYVNKCLLLPLAAGEEHIELVPAIRMTGRVVNQLGHPVMNATIGIQDWPPVYSGPSLMASWGRRTDSNGAFELNNAVGHLEEGSITVHATTHHGEGAREKINVPLADAKQGRLIVPTIVIQECLGATLRVIDDKRMTPIDTAHLVPLGGWEWRWVGSKAADPDRYDLWMTYVPPTKPIQADFTLHAPGYGSLRMSIAIDMTSPKTHVVRMKAGHPVSGRVQWQDGEAAPATLIVLEHGLPESEEKYFSPGRRGTYEIPGILSSGRTTEDGHFELPPLAEGRYRLLASSDLPSALDEERPKVAMTFDIPLEGELIAVMGPLESRLLGVEVRGTVLDLDGTPISWAGEVVAQHEGSARFSPRPRVRLSDGQFRMRMLSEGLWKLTAIVQGKMFESIDVVIDDATPRVLVRTIRASEGLNAILDLQDGDAPVNLVRSIELRANLSGRSVVATLVPGTRSTDAVQLEPDTAYSVTVHSKSESKLISSPSTLMSPKSGAFRQKLSVHGSAVVHWDVPTGEELNSHAETGLSTYDLAILRSDGTKVFDGKAWAVPRSLPCGSYKLKITPPDAPPQELSFEVQWSPPTHVRLLR